LLLFTGIVRGRAHIQHIHVQPGLHTLELVFPDRALDGVETGASIALAGTCLTVTSFEAHRATFDVIQETLDRTTLGELQPGDEVNFERAACFGSEIGGHLLSGHILETTSLVDRHVTPSNTRLTFQVSVAAAPYILEKGYVALNGCSLTIGDVDKVKRQFDVHLIPETLRITTFDTIQVGAQVNLEVDATTQAVVDTVQRIMQARS
jgi:riboflavin synthase